MHQKGNKKCGSDSRQGGGLLAGGRSRSLGDGHSLASAGLGKEVCYSLAGTACGPRKPRPRLPKGATASKARSSQLLPPPPPACLAPLSAPGRNSEMGVRPADDPGANRKTAFASWTIYGSCLKHGCFCDARYNGYSSEEGILCTRDVLCLV